MSPVHPRTHGEHFQPSFQKISRYRFIPVHTGNTSPFYIYSAHQAVHPRTHGEHQFSLFFQAIKVGSSPYTRGTLMAFSISIRSYLRFIPVHTGNTTHRMVITQRGTVHPRTHGEHGSTLLGRRISVRFIPVHTGNT